MVIIKNLILTMTTLPRNEATVMDLVHTMIIHPQRVAIQGLVLMAITLPQTEEVGMEEDLIRTMITLHQNIATDGLVHIKTIHRHSVAMKIMIIHPQTTAMTNLDRSKTTHLHLQGTIICYTQLYEKVLNLVLLQE